MVADVLSRRYGCFIMPGLALDTTLRFVRGVGPARSEELAKAAVETVLDLLLRCPIRYELIPICKPIAEWRDGEPACLAGEIVSVRWTGGRRSPSIVARVSDGSDIGRIIWFNTPYLKSKLAVGRYIRATGRARYTEQGMQLTNPTFQLYDGEDDLTTPTQERWKPVYSAIGSTPSRRLEKIITNCLSHVDWPGDYLPTTLREKRNLFSLPDAVRQIHQPDSLEAAAQARQRLAYDELLISQIHFARARKSRQNNLNAPVLPVTPEIDRRIRRRFPFTLTPAQDRACLEICSDLSNPKPMFRLLQGDVGCGKTAVAVYAALVTIANRHQVAFLAPTEILARQHYERINLYLADSAVQSALATGSLAAAARQELKVSLAAGQINLVIGTHALLEEDIRFHQLGLVIIDEQHRFGVQQRQALQAKGRLPHYLVLSATPIPRTQALALFGDLDMSVIDALPTGRGRISTHLVHGESTHHAWTRIRCELDKGRQAYFVYPIIEDSDKLPLKAASSEFERLRAEELSGYRCELLHGKMNAKSKLEAINGFRRGDVQALVSTTVVEVGVDIPNATVMAVFHAERYGLAQLHQLRGRVGRGSADAQFFMFTDSDNDIVLKRLHILQETTDGFQIAEADLKLRGPGEILGTQQHGLPAYRFAQLAIDLELLYAAREDARSLANGDVQLAPAERDLLEILSREIIGSSAPLVHVG